MTNHSFWLRPIVSISAKNNTRVANIVSQKSLETLRNACPGTEDVIEDGVAPSRWG